MRTPRLRTLAIPCAALLLGAPPAQAQDIDTGTPPTVPNWPIFPFGRGTEVSWVSFGQSFVVGGAGGATRLDQFQFWFRDNAITGTTPYHAYIFAWDPATRRTGDNFLFRSGPQTYTGATVPTPVSFVTGGLNLTAGQSYIAVLSSVEFPDAPIGLRPGIVLSTAWPEDGYAGGMSFVRFGPAGLGTLTSGAWNLAGGTGDDLAFRATFSAAADGPPTSTVPEPTSVALVASGMLGVAVLARRRRVR